MDEKFLNDQQELHVNISRTPGYALHILLPSDLFGEEWFKSQPAEELPASVMSAIKALTSELIKWRLGYDIRASESPST